MTSGEIMTQHPHLHRRAPTHSHHHALLCIHTPRPRGAHTVAVIDAINRVFDSICLNQRQWFPSPSFYKTRFTCQFFSSQHFLLLFHHLTRLPCSKSQYHSSLHPQFSVVKISSTVVQLFFSLSGFSRHPQIATSSSRASERSVNWAPSHITFVLFPYFILPISFPPFTPHSLLSLVLAQYFPLLHLLHVFPRKIP